MAEAIESAVVVDGAKYEIDLKVDGDTLLATSQDFPEVTTFGVDVVDALEHAKDAVEEAIERRLVGLRDLRENPVYRDLDVMEAAAEILEEHCLKSCSVRSVIRELRGERYE